MQKMSKNWLKICYNPLESASESFVVNLLATLKLQCRNRHATKLEVIAEVFAAETLAAAWRPATVRQNFVLSCLSPPREVFALEVTFISFQSLLPSSCCDKEIKVLCFISPFPFAERNKTKTSNRETKTKKNFRFLLGRSSSPFFTSMKFAHKATSPRSISLFSVTASFKTNISRNLWRCEGIFRHTHHREASYSLMEIYLPLIHIKALPEASFLPSHWPSTAIRLPEST